MPTNPTDFTVPPLTGRHVFLRPITPDDYRLLRIAETSGELGVRWRFRGASVSPEAWARTIWDGSLAQYIVARREKGAPIGVVSAYRANFHDGHACVAAAKFDLENPQPLLMIGVALFIDYVFACWNFEKLYFEVAEYNLAQFGSGLDSLLDEEGRLRGHYWYGNHRWDQVILALYRKKWLLRRDHLLRGQVEVRRASVHISVPRSYHAQEGESGV